MGNIYEALVDTVGKQVTLTVNAQPEAEGAATSWSCPSGTSRPLYYYNWVEGNIER